jgi:hypothetical protein
MFKSEWFAVPALTARGLWPNRSRLGYDGSLVVARIIMRDPSSLRTSSVRAQGGAATDHCQAQSPRLPPAQHH